MRSSSGTSCACRATATDGPVKVEAICKSQSWECSPSVGPSFGVHFVVHVSGLKYTTVLSYVMMFLAIDSMPDCPCTVV